MTIIATIIFVAAMFGACAQGMFWMMDREALRKNAAILWEIAQAQDGEER